MNVSPVRRAEPQEDPKPRVKLEPREEPKVDRRQEAQEAPEEPAEKKLIAKA